MILLLCIITILKIGWITARSEHAFPIYIFWVILLMHFIFYCQLFSSSWVFSPLDLSVRPTHKWWLPLMFVGLVSHASDGTCCLPWWGGSSGWWPHRITSASSSTRRIPDAVKGRPEDSSPRASWTRQGVIIDHEWLLGFSTENFPSFLTSLLTSTV